MSSSADQQKQQRRRRRAREVENASQTQVHHFDEQDDDQDQEDDDEEEEEEGRDDERHRHQTSRMNPDPYNVQLMSSSQPHHDYPVYDSMSTILEVDSEGASQVSDQDTKSTSSERPRDLGSPLEVQTTPTRRQQRSSGSPVGGLSPGDKFGGTLSALAAQMERLQKKASSGQATGRSQDFTSSSSSTGTTPEGDQRRSPTKTGHDQDRATSAESLMMINISPVGSPRVKFPLTRQATSKSDSPIVEVSNKSTNTLIDMKLMQQMAEKYFIEQSDKSTQSIKFDCDENEFKTIDMINQRTGGSYQAKPQTKSIAVGTEKFSRERFSLLPATKTRSTQTKANMSDSDIGTSETRRFKLSHLSNLGPIIKANQTRRTGETTSEKRASPDRKPAELSVVRATGSESDDSLALEINKKGKDAEETRRINQKVEPAQKQPTKKEDSVSSSSDTTNYTSDDSLSTQSKGTTKSDEPTTTKEISAPPAKSDSKPATAIKTRGPSRDPKTQITLSEEKQVEDPQQQQQGQQIPSLKTELRVIIEFADSRNKQRNEMLSNSNLINGILNKRTEVSTSKHVAVSPRQVLERLQSAGQRHSLMYLPHQVAPQVTEHHGHHPQELPPAVTLPAQPQGGWQEVSRSTVCNEIESDTTRRTRHSTSNGNPNDQLIMSSDATIRQLPEDKSAIHLRSRATRRQQQPDPSSQRDKLLVESVAAFDESQLAEEVTPPSKGQVSAEKTSIIANQQVAASPAPPAKPEPLKPVNLGRQPNQPSHEQPRFVSSPFSRSPNQFVRQQTNRPQPIVMRRDEPLESPPPLQRPQQSPLRPTGHHREPPQVTSTARVEFEEEKEDRRQIRQNGRLIYDDRLREHHFESRRQPQTPSSPVQQPSQAPSGGIMRHSPRIAASSPNLNVTPSDRWHQRHSMQQQAVTTPASSTRLANTQPPPMFADQTSNLSSDQETLDSGFVQSGAGSSSNLINQQQQIHRRHQLTSMGNLRLSPHLQSAPTSPILVSKPAKSVQRQPKLSKHNDEDDDNSLTFVDDDDDDFVDQLGGSSRRLNRPRAKPLKRKEAMGDQQRLRGFISPPLEFRNNRDNDDRHMKRAGSMPRLTAFDGPAKNQLRSSKPTQDSELVTRLTRCKFKKQTSGGQIDTKPTRRRTLTKLEQNLVAPETLPTKATHTRPGQPHNRYQFKAQVMFESDTDTSAVATDRQSVASSSSRTRQPRTSSKKEMITKTCYSLTNGRAADWTKTIREDELDASGGVIEASRSNGTARVLLSKRDAKTKKHTEVSEQQRRPTGVGTILMPNWDYSLKVNRMRGNRLDSKVKTLIRHSRQPSLVVD